MVLILILLFDFFCSCFCRLISHHSYSMLILNDPNGPMYFVIMCVGERVVWLFCTHSYTHSLILPHHRKRRFFTLFIICLCVCVSLYLYLCLPHNFTLSVLLSIFFFLFPLVICFLLTIVFSFFSYFRFFIQYFILRPTWNWMINYRFFLISLTLLHEVVVFIAHICFVNKAWIEPCVSKRFLW